MPVARIAVLLLAAACGGSGDKPAPAAPTPSTSAPPVPPPKPKDRAQKLAMTAAACFVGQVWVDARSDAATADERSATSRQCKDLVRGAVGSEDPSQIEALRVYDATILVPLESKVKELADEDGLDDAQTAPISRFETAVVAAAREATNARRAAAKIRGDIEKIKSDRVKRAARDRVATHLSASEAAVVATLKNATALDALARMADGPFANDAHASAIVLALARARAAQDLPRHMKLYTAGPALAAVFGVPTPPLPDRTRDRLKPGAWVAYLEAVAKACGHPVDASAAAKDRESLAWNAVLAGFADRLDAAAPDVKGQGLATTVRAAAESLKSASPTPTP